MWFISSILVVLWVIAIMTAGIGALWVHALLLGAVVLGCWRAVRRLRNGGLQSGR